MYCTKCETEVSIADKHCPKCGIDLLKFGATKSSGIQTKGKYATGMKDLKKEIFGEVRDEIGHFKTAESFDPMEASILKPLYSNLLNILNARYESDQEIEDVFNARIIPEMDRLSRHEDTLKFLLEIEKTIQSRLGEDFFRYYEEKGNDVLKILRAGEIAVKLTKLLYQADLSMILFPFFKSAELACYFHTRRCYRNLKDHSQFENIARWLPSKEYNYHIENLPDWLKKRKKKIIEVVKGIFEEDKINTAGSLATGVALHLFSRTWEMKIHRVDRGETKTFYIDNWLAARGNDREKEALAEKLQGLQSLRNKLVHEDVEDNHETVKTYRDLSYECLNGLPAIFRI